MPKMWGPTPEIQPAGWRKEIACHTDGKLWLLTLHQRKPTAS
jgi:hypothetical protein